jgi:hypothetical protein
MKSKSTLAIFAFLVPLLMGFIGWALAPDECKCVLQWKSDAGVPTGKNYTCRTNGCARPCPESPTLLGGEGTEDDPLVFTCQCSDADICNCKGYMHLWTVNGVPQSGIDCVGGCSDASKRCKASTISAFYQDACACI